MYIVYDHILSRPYFDDKKEIDFFEKILTIFEEDKRRRQLIERKFFISQHRFLSGLIPYIQYHAEKANISIFLENPPVYSDIKEIVSPKDIVLRDYQVEVVKRSLYYGRGINDLVTGAGKTVIAGTILLTLDKPSLFIVHTRELAEQTKDEFIRFGIDEKDVGIFSGQQKNLNKKHIIGLVQSLNRAVVRREKEITDFLSSREILIIDETHHLPASSYMRVANRCRAPYRFGLSGSVFVDMDSPTADTIRLMGVTGKIINQITYQDLLEKNYLSFSRCYFLNGSFQSFPVQDDYMKMYKECIVFNDERNDMICKHAAEAYENNQKVCIIVKIIEHGEILLQKLFEKYHLQSYFYMGDNIVKTYKDGLRSYFASSYLPISSFKEKDRFILILSPAFFEGIDIPSISVIIRADAGRSKKIDYQVIGRGLRMKKDNSILTIIDFDDTFNYVFKHQSRKRRQNYSDLGIPIL